MRTFSQGHLPQGALWPRWHPAFTISSASVCLGPPAQTACSLPTDPRVHSKSVLWGRLLLAGSSLRCLRLVLAAPLSGAAIQHVQEGDPPQAPPSLETGLILYLPGNLGHLGGQQPTFARPWLPGLCGQSEHKQGPSVSLSPTALPTHWIHSV